MFEAAADSDGETINDELSQLFDEDNGLSETGRMIRFQFRQSFSFFQQVYICRGFCRNGVVG